MKNWFLPLHVVVFVMSSLIFSDALAQGTLNYSPNPITYGAAVTYSLPSNVAPTSRVIWSYACTSNPKCGGQFVTSANNYSTYPLYETIPGNFTVIAKVTYTSGGTGTFTVNVTVPPPDTAKPVILANNPLTSPTPGYVYTLFGVYSQGKPITTWPSTAYPQESMAHDGLRGGGPIGAPSRYNQPDSSGSSSA